MGVSRSDISVANASSAAIAAHLAVKKIKKRVEQIGGRYILFVHVLHLSSVDFNSEKTLFRDERQVYLGQAGAKKRGGWFKSLCWTLLNMVILLNITIYFVIGWRHLMG